MFALLIALLRSITPLSAQEVPTTKPADAPAARIDKVFFAQQHVLEPSSPYFQLVSNLPALIKVQLHADAPGEAPYVFAVLKIGDKRTELRLQGPRVMPKPYTGDPVLMPQTYDDSYTAMIPSEWIKPGLEVAVELRSYDFTSIKQRTDRETAASADPIRVLDRRDLGKLKVGAPNAVTMNMFYFHYFGRHMNAEHPEGWEDEFKNRNPMSELTVHKAPRLILKPMVWAPSDGSPAVLCSSPEEYEQKTGKKLPDSRSMTLQLLSPLKDAAGTEKFWRLYYANICGLHNGGVARFQFIACGDIDRPGIILHECGHAMRLPHCVSDKNYPYTSTMYGSTPGQATTPNAGPTWGFDLTRREFLSAYTKTDAGYEWTKDPMQGGGEFPGPAYIYKHFSDYNVNKMQNTLDTLLVVWNDALGEYARWNPETGAYDKVVANDGVQLPAERDVEVFSVLATASLVTKEANLVYPPIGPYTAGLIRRFNADSEEDRKAAAQLGWGEKGRNVCLRITQGGKVTTYILDKTVSEKDDPLKTFHMFAINLPARDGKITHVDVLIANDVVTKGVGADAKVLYTWSDQ